MISFCWAIILYGMFILPFVVFCIAVVGKVFDD